MVSRSTYLQHTAAVQVANSNEFYVGSGPSEGGAPAKEIAYDPETQDQIMAAFGSAYGPIQPTQLKPDAENEKA